MAGQAGEPKTLMGLEPARRAEPELIRTFSQWRPMYAFQNVPVLGLLNRDCLDDLDGIVMTTYFDTRTGSRLETARDDVWTERRIRLGSPETLTVLRPNGDKHEITFTVAEMVTHAGAFSATTFCRYLANDPADGARAPRLNTAILGADNPYSYTEPLALVPVSTRSAPRARGARPVAPAMRYDLQGNEFNVGRPGVWNRHATRHDRWQLAKLLRLAQRPDIAAFLRTDLEDPTGIDHTKDLTRVSIQAFDIALEPRRRQRLWSINYLWENNAGSKLWLWAVFTGRGEPREPLYLWRSDDSSWESSNGFEFTAVADLDGDGREELTGSRTLFEASSDVILTWDKGAPVVVYDSDWSR